MNYPLISEYVEAIKMAEDNLDQLSYLRPVLDADGHPVMSSGNFAVVFKMKDVRNGNLYALKCFTRFQEGRKQAYKLISDELSKNLSPYLVSIKYIEGELFVYSKNTSDTCFPVALMDWVEGITLDKYIRQHLHEQSLLQKLSEKFIRMSTWLKSQNFAHGDLKPDNILTLEDGSLVLVDYDGMFVPAMKGQKARELGSPDYRHPSRTINDFNEHIDDFSLASIAMQLYAISLKPNLLRTLKDDTLLLTEADYRDLNNSKVMAELFSLVSNVEFEKLFSIFLQSYSQGSPPTISYHSLNTKLQADVISTKVTVDDKANGIKDEFGVIYSRDGKRLIKAPRFKANTKYTIRQGTKAICDGAFFESFWTDYQSIEIPNSVTTIGYSAFGFCSGLTSIVIPNSVTTIGECAFEYCGLTKITLPNSLTTINKATFQGCKGLTSITLPNFVTTIGVCAFDGCERLTSITLPNSIKIIEDWAFAYCRDLTRIALSNSLTTIGRQAFRCSGLTQITIPNSVVTIGEFAFQDSLYLTQIIIPNSVTAIGDGAFSYCYRMTSMIVERGNLYYDSRNNCNAIIETASNTLIAGCRNTIIPNSVTTIGALAFNGCNGLTSIIIPNSVKTIEKNAFGWCRELVKISISNSLTSIGENAFSCCDMLTSITLPNSVISIGEEAFSTCNSLAGIYIPKGSRDKFKILLGKYSFYNLIEI